MVIEYNQQGWQITEQDVGNDMIINITPNLYLSFYISDQKNSRLQCYHVLDLTHPPQSDAVFAFNKIQVMDNAIAQLFLNFSNYRTGQLDAIVGRVYVVEFRRANTFEVSERANVFD